MCFKCKTYPLSFFAVEALFGTGLMQTSFVIFDSIHSFVSFSLLCVLSLCSSIRIFWSARSSGFALVKKLKIQETYRKIIVSNQRFQNSFQELDLVLTHYSLKYSRIQHNLEFRVLVKSFWKMNVNKSLIVFTKFVEL